MELLLLSLGKAKVKFETVQKCSGSVIEDGSSLVLHGNLPVRFQKMGNKERMTMFVL